jgi:fumarylpyruvate hydrolase
MSYAIALSAQPKLKIKGSDLYFPVSRMFGIGRNYSENLAAEKKDEKKTVLFMKDAYMLSPAEEGIVYPEDTQQLRYEIEMVVAIGKEGRNVLPSEAEQYIYGYAVGIDFTNYDAQDLAKENGWPWDRGKSFLGCAPCSPITRKEEVAINNNTIWLKKNNIEVQSGSLNQMIWNINETIALVSSSFGLLPGDIIFTGTPKGIGMTKKGDELSGGVDGLDTIKFLVK